MANEIRPGCNGFTDNTAQLIEGISNLEIYQETICYFWITLVYYWNTALSGYSETQCRDSRTLALSTFFWLLLDSG